MERRTIFVLITIIAFILIVSGTVYYIASNWNSGPLDDDPSLRKPGNDSGISIDENLDELSNSLGNDTEKINTNVKSVRTDEDINIFISSLNLPEPFLGVTEEVTVESIYLARPSGEFEVDDNLYEAFREDVSSKHAPLFLNDTFFVSNGGEKVYYESFINFSEFYILNDFSDSNYNESENVTGFNITKNSKMIDYILEFDDFEKSYLDESFITIFGREYFAIDKSRVNSNPVLLESPYRFRLFEGRDINGNYPGQNESNFSIEFFGESEVKLTVNGETTRLIEEKSYNNFPKMNVFVDAVLHSSEVSSVELIISPKEIIIHDNYIEFKEKAVDEIEFSLISSGTEYDSLKMTWTTDKDLFITPENIVAIPFFENLEFAMTVIYKSSDNSESSNVSMNVYSYDLLQNIEDEGFISGNVVKDTSSGNGFISRLFG